MERRSFLVGAGLSAMGSGLEAENAGQKFETDGVSFQAWHGNGRLHCSFTAPTRGWVAVGFNNQQRLKGTRFVIGALFGGSLRVEEHIAVVPSHPTVEAMGLASAVNDGSGGVSDGKMSLRFSLPHLFTDTDNPTLLSGTVPYLMLAWSHEVDFAHHSAWRRHFSIDL